MGVSVLLPWTATERRGEWKREYKRIENKNEIGRDKKGEETLSVD